MALTGSRGAFLALGVTGLIFLISLVFNPNNELNYLLRINVQKISLIVLISLLTVFSVVFVFKNNDFIKNNYILHRLTSMNLRDGSSFSRIIVSKIGIDCFLQKPLLGYGFDNFEICYQNNFDNMMVEVLPRENRFDKAHNMPIEILATTGIIGFVFFACIYVFGYKNIRDLIAENKIDFYAGLSLILGIAAYFIQNIFVFDVFEGFIGFCLLLAYIIFLSNSKK
ncbi:MAG: O-antigen ligase family protein, partial [Candidatus Pacebacteria bacterium]|nr:O-antigen ligase family protein [Candidatus Paceibacterota bacterium]